MNIKNNSYNYCFIYFIFFIFVLNFNIINSQTVIPQSEYECYERFIQKFNLKVGYYASNGDLISFCSVTSGGCHANGSINSFYGRQLPGDEVTPGVELLLSDVSCFPYVTRFSIGDIQVSDEFLYNKLPNVANVNFELNYITEFTQPLPKYDSVIFTSAQMRTLKISNLNNVGIFTAITPALTIEVDSAAIKTTLKTISASVLNLPNFSGYQFNTLRLTFKKGFNPSEILNYQYVNANYAEFFIENTLTVPFYPHLSSNVKKLVHNGDFDAPTQIYDLSSYEGVALNFVGPKFFYNNQIPVIAGNNTNLHFSSSIHPKPASLTPPPFPALKNVGYLKTLSYDYSFLTGDLPEYDGKGTLAHSFQNNKLTGTISSSWCSTAINVNNNSLSGSLPSCFSCYYNSSLNFPTGFSGVNYIINMPTVWERFKNNNFNNYDKSIPCTTYKPQIRVFNRTTIIISGQDISQDVGHFYIERPNEIAYQCKRIVDSIIILGYEYFCTPTVYLNFETRDFITLYNIGTQLNYIMALKSKPPAFTVIKTSNNNIISISGSFFSSYMGQSIQSLTISGIDCQITSTSFNSIQCLASVKLESERQLVILNNGNQTKKVYAVFENDRINNITCPNDCVGNPNGDICDLSTGQCVGCPNGCSSPNGVCNESKGRCECNSNFQNVDCGTPFIQCPSFNGQICNNVGTCNNITGICTCDSNHQGLDCGTPFIQCPSYNGKVCNNAGTCDNTIGKCTCDSSHQGSNCGTPFVQCPSFNNQICNNAGTCNNQTGYCTCDSSHQGSNCGTPFIQCPSYNGKICNNVGTCDNTIGKCTCDSSHQGLDCGTPFVQCPSFNNEICNNAGTCDNTIGKCTCDSSHQGLDCSTPFIECPSYNGQICNGAAGICSNITGVCTCDSSHQGLDCGTPITFECPTFNGKDCNNAGTCNETTGKCTCDPPYYGEDCSLLDCLNDCTSSSNGICNQHTGICKCNSGFQGQSCEFIEHYITSVYPSNENGGEASFVGHFGMDHYDLSIKIGLNDCSITFVSNDQINCTASPGIGIHSVNITQNNISYFGKNIYEYVKLDQVIQCPNDCSSNGVCLKSGTCECYKGFSSYDCSSLDENNNNNNSTNPPNTNIDNGTGIVDINKEKINFNIYLNLLKEIDINNNVVKSYPLISDWTVNKTESNIYVFEQSPNNDEFTVTSTIELVSKERNVSFAGVDFKLDKGSTKFTISVKNYKYQSFLNTLQLEMVSNVTELNNDSCNKKDTSLDTDYFNNQYESNYIKLSRNNIDFVGRFINKVVSDSKPTFLSTSYTNLNNSIIINLHLPHCVSECLIDPDFSVLLSSDFSHCRSPKENIKWQIPVGIVVGAVGVSCIGILFYKKSSIIKINGQKMSMKPK